MAFPSGSARISNRVMTVLVLVTIALVAYWGVNGGLDQIVITETSLPAVTE